MAFRATFAAVQDAVAAAVAAALPQGVPCDVGYPPGGPQADHVWVSAEAECQLDVAEATARQRLERGTVTVHVLCTRIARDCGVARDAALTLAAAAEGAIASDPTLGGLVWLARVVSVKGEEAVLDDRQRQYGVTLTVAYEVMATT